MTFHVRNGGVWEEVYDPSVRVAGVWRDVDEGWVRVAGVWRQFYQRAPFLQVARTIENLGVIVKGSGSSTANFRLETDGTITVAGTASPTIDDLQEWLPSGTPGDWHVRATLTSGTTPTSNAGLSTWLALTSGRTWGNSRSGSSAGSTTSTLTLEFSNDGGTTVAATYVGTTITAQLV